MPRLAEGEATVNELAEPFSVSKMSAIVRVEFHDHGGKTRMTLSDGPYPGGARHAAAGYEAAFDKLAAHLA